MRLSGLPPANPRRASFSRMSRRAVAWTLAAVLGLALAAGVSWATSRLTSVRIGLASEPITAGSRLAPQNRAAGAGGTTTRNATPRASKRTTRPQLTEPSVRPPAATSPEPPAAGRTGGSRPPEASTAGGGDDSHPRAGGGASRRHDD